MLLTITNLIFIFVEFQYEVSYGIGIFLTIYIHVFSKHTNFEDCHLLISDLFIEDEI